MAFRNNSIKAKLNRIQNVALLVSLVGSLLLTLIVSFAISRHRRVNQWEQDVHQVHKSLDIYEENISTHANPTLYAVEQFLIESGLNQESLDKARREFRLNGIFLISKDGHHHSFTHETCFSDLIKTEHWDNFNLLELDPSYIRMQNQKSFETVVSTPIKWLYKC